MFFKCFIFLVSSIFLSNMAEELKLFCDPADAVTQIKGFDLSKFTGEWYEVGKSVSNYVNFTSGKWEIFKQVEYENSYGFLYSGRNRNERCIKPIKGIIHQLISQIPLLVVDYNITTRKIGEPCQIDRMETYDKNELREIDNALDKCDENTEIPCFLHCPPCCLQSEDGCVACGCEPLNVENTSKEKSCENPEALPRMENFKMWKFTGEWYELGKSKSNYINVKDGMWKIMVDSKHSDNYNFIYSGRNSDEQCIKPIVGNISMLVENTGILQLKYEVQLLKISEILWVLHTDYTSVAVIYTSLHSKNNKIHETNMYYPPGFTGSLWFREPHVSGRVYSEAMKYFQEFCINSDIIKPRNLIGPCKIDNLNAGANIETGKNISPYCEVYPPCALHCPPCCNLDENSCMKCKCPGTLENTEEKKACKHGVLPITENFQLWKFTGEWYEVGKSKSNYINVNDGMWKIMIDSNSTDDYKFVYSGRNRNEECIKPIEGKLSRLHKTAGNFKLDYQVQSSKIRETMWVLYTDYTSVAVVYLSVEKIAGKLKNINMYNPARFVGSLWFRNPHVNKKEYDRALKFFQDSCVDSDSIKMRSINGPCPIDDLNSDAQIEAGRSKSPQCKTTHDCALHCPLCCREDKDGCMSCECYRLDVSKRISQKKRKENIVVLAFEGNSVKIPCNVGDSPCGMIQKIKWSKRMPSGDWKRLYLYSDSKGKSYNEFSNSQKVKHFVERSSAHLLILRSTIEDGGLYKCDVTHYEENCLFQAFVTLQIMYDSSNEDDAMLRKVEL